MEANERTTLYPSFHGLFGTLRVGDCLDACDSIMDKMGYARGLVSYTSEHQLQGGKTPLLGPQAQRTQFTRHTFLDR